MPKLIEVPETLRAYTFHGLELFNRGENWIGDCPFCNSEGKLSIKVENGVVRCFSCRLNPEEGKDGINASSFIRLLWEISQAYTTEEEYQALAKEKNLLNSSTLIEWGFRKSRLTDEWVVPAYNPQGVMIQLCRYIRDRESGKYRLWATPGLNQGLYGVNLFNREAKTVHVCEGVFDAMALWEVLKVTKVEEEEAEEGQPPGMTLSFTGGKDNALEDSSVLAVPSCNIFYGFWAELMQAKRVCLLYDNDYPKKQEGSDKLQLPAGYAGMKASARKLTESEFAPADIQYLSWHIAGDTHDPNLPNHYDVRDLITSGDTVDGRIDKLADLLEKIRPIPTSWKSTSGYIHSSDDMNLLPCSDWEDLTNAWRKAAKWTPGHDLALAVGLSSIASTEVIGDQLWCKIVSPPGTGKTMISQALTTNRKYTKEVNNFTGFHSGYRGKGDAGKVDKSLLAQVKGKTMITKDGDTLLQQPNLPKILAEARDIYDGATQTFYRNDIAREYRGVRLTWILCGTASLHRLDSSELGERFLDCVILKKIDKALEKEILLRKAYQAYNNRAVMANGKVEGHFAPNMAKAMSMTGGYVSHLRANADKMLANVDMSAEVIEQIFAYAQFVAYIRCRPSKSQEEEVEKELGTRLISQLIRLATCLAVVKNKEVVNAEILANVKKVAMDTARGRALEICKWLYLAGKGGVNSKTLAAKTTFKEESEYNLLVHMKRIEAVESFRPLIAQGQYGEQKWRLTPELARLYREITKDEQGSN